MVRPIQRATILLLLLLFLPLSCHAENLKASLDPKVSTTQNPILLGNSSQDVDYSLVEEDIEEVESTNKTSVIESSTENTLAQQYLNTLLPEEAPAEEPILDESRLVENAPGMITNMSDIVKLVMMAPKKIQQPI